MAGQSDNLVLEHLKAIRAQTNNLSSDMQDMKMRLTDLERGMAMILSGQADGYGSQVRQQVTIDRLVERIQRIEKRLELADQ